MTDAKTPIKTSLGTPGPGQTIRGGVQHPRTLARGLIAEAAAMNGALSPRAAKASS